MKWLFLFFLFASAGRSASGAVHPLLCPDGTILHDSICKPEEHFKESKEKIESTKDSQPSEPIPDAECLPGSKWESNCHSCECLETGTANCIKQNNCNSNFTEAEPIRCKPNTRFYKDCNTCVCLENGLGLCTLKKCSRSTVLTKPELLSGQECSPGSFWKSQCNNCHCNDNGLAVCTYMACPGRENEPIMVCAPNTMWKNDCNTCWCSSAGSAMCTRMECYSINNYGNEEEKNSDIKSVTNPNLTLSRKTRGAQEPPKACTPGQEFRLDCNKCLCDNEGQNFSCTRIDCSSINNNHNSNDFSSSRTVRDVAKKESSKCVPGSVFKQGCNVCRCTDEGYHATCSVNLCRDADNDSKEPEEDPGFRCNAGEQFKRNCNDCTCSADGKSVFCTIRLCDNEFASDI